MTAIEKWKSKYENGEKVKSGLGEQIGSWWNSSSPRLRGGKWKSTGNIRKWKLEGERWILKEFIGSPLSGWQMKICCDVWNGAKMRPTSAKLPSVSLDGSGTGGVLSAKIISSYLCVWEWDYMVIICLLLLFRFFPRFLIPGADMATTTPAHCFLNRFFVAASQVKRTLAFWAISCCQNCVNSWRAKSL